MGTNTGAATGRVVGSSRSEPVDALVRARHRIEAHDVRSWRNASLGSTHGEARPLLRPSSPPVIVAGVEEADIAGLRVPTLRIGVGCLESALRRQAPLLVAVLGDEALRRLSPAAIGPLLQRPGCVSLGQARTCLAPVVADWARRSPIEFVPAGRLVRRVSLACRLGGAHVDEEASCCGVEGEHNAMRRALVVLQQTEDCRVKSWARALGTSRHALRRLCLATIDLLPEDVAWQFLDVRVRRCVARGDTDARIAVSAGYASGFALRRAYAMRGIPFPRP